MFGEKARRITELSDEVKGLQAQLDEVAPFIDDAKTISDHVGELMQRPGSIGYTASQIAAQAFKNIHDQRINEVRNQLAAQYTAEHQDALYKQLLDEVREQEGAQMDKDAQTLVQTNADFIETVRNKARTAVWQEVLDRIAITEKTSVEAALLLEEERRIFFNEFNVRFKFDGEINLNDEELLRHLKHGDRLQIELMALSSKVATTLEMQWRKETEKQQGWSLHHASPRCIFIAESEWKDGYAPRLPMQLITPVYAIGGTGTHLYNLVKDDTQIGITKERTSYQIRVGAADHEGKAVVTDCKILPKIIESLDTEVS